ncbi:MAG: hypothetical protein ACO1TE_04520 [Prosthecobacter sp.]
MNVRSASALFDSLIAESFPEFISAANGSRMLSRRTACWKYRRADGLYECLSVQFGTLSDEETAININGITHYFEECPDPSGVFGWSFNVMDELEKDASEVVFRHLGGLNWLHFNSANVRKELSECLSILAFGARQMFENAATQLAADAFRKRAYEYCMSLERSANVGYEQLHEALAKYGEPLPIRGLNYTAVKAAHQVHAWLTGEKNWSQL